jgi:hypothetical protein
MCNKTIAVHSEPHKIHKRIMRGKKLRSLYFKQNTGKGKVISPNYLKED